MMYKDKDKQREYNRNRMKATRQGNTKTGKCVTLPVKNVLPGCPEMVILSDGKVWHSDPKYWHPVNKKEREYPGIVYALTDPIKRKRLVAITRELKTRRVADGVRYGIDGVTFDIVGELLDCVKI